MRWELAVLLVGCTYTAPGSSNVADDGATADAMTEVDGSTPDGASQDAPPDVPAMAVCPGYQALANGFPAGTTYRGVSTRMTWQTARQACQADGGDLVVVDNDAEAGAVIQLAADPGNSPFIWVGLRDDDTTTTDNDFISVRGGAPAFTPWGPSQPNGGTADCVLIADNTTHDLWDFVCNATQVFVCECLP